MANLTKRRKRVECDVLDAIERCAAIVKECPSDVDSAKAAYDLSRVLPNLTWLKEDV